ncbi:TetR family transcriptional regulator [Marinobacteraceae bacterium S3BR75-40.1]
MTKIARQGENTRQKILLTAMRLYAEKGLDGVSLRTISAQSGTRNSAAAHYHFGNRIGVIEAIVAFISDHLRPTFHAGLSRLEAQERVDLRDLIKTLFAPYLILSREPEWGPDALRFMAHLHTDNTAEISAVLIRNFQLDMERIEALLHRALPDIPRQMLRVRLAFSLVLLIHGSAEVELLTNTPFGNIRPDDATLFHSFVDYVEAAVRGAPAAPR